MDLDELNVYCACLPCGRFGASEVDDFRGWQQVRFDFTGSTNNTNALTRLHLFHRQQTSSLRSIHTLLQQYQHHHRITASQHRTIPASSFARTISTFFHTPYTPPSLNICTLQLLPSAAVSAVNQSPLVRLRLRHARRHYTSRIGWLATHVHRQPDKFQTNSLQPCPR
jgi:hypothetical protein